MINFPLKLGVGESQNVSQYAGFVYYESGSAGGMDNSIKVSVDDGRGSEYILKPGQGFRSTGFTSLVVSNNKGQGTIIGTLTLADKEFFDNRVVGTVEVIDGGLARTLGKVAFTGTVGNKTASNLFSWVQIWNPAASGKNLIVEQFGLTTDTAGQMVIYSSISPQATKASSPASKLIGAPVSVAEMRYDGKNNADAGVVAMMLLQLQANIPYNWKMTEPIIVPQGYGIVFGGGQNASVNANVEFYEQAI